MWRRAPTAQEGAVREAEGRLRLYRGVEFILALGGFLVAVLAALWLSAPAWKLAVPPGHDVIGHLARVEFAIEHFVHEGRLDGWRSAPSSKIG